MKELFDYIFEDFNNHEEKYFKGTMIAFLGYLLIHVIVAIFTKAPGFDWF